MIWSGETGEELVGRNKWRKHKSTINIAKLPFGEKSRWRADAGRFEAQRQRFESLPALVYLRAITSLVPRRAFTNLTKDQLSDKFDTRQNDRHTAVQKHVSHKYVPNKTYELGGTTQAFRTSRAIQCQVRDIW